MMRPAVAVELAIYRLLHKTYFEIHGLREVQNRGTRPWLVPVSQQPHRFHP